MGEPGSLLYLPCLGLSALPAWTILAHRSRVLPRKGNKTKSTVGHCVPTVFLGWGLG